MTINTVSCSIDVAKEALRKLMLNSVTRKLACYLHSAPGVGKSETIAQLAEEEDWGLIDLRLTRMDATDLTGLPYFKEDTKQTVYYLPDFYPTEEMIKGWGKKGCIIFLDELSAK